MKKVKYVKYKREYNSVLQVMQLKKVKTYASYKEIIDDYPILETSSSALQQFRNHLYNKTYIKKMKNGRLKKQSYKSWKGFVWRIID